ncbi:unnamed protein product [Thlaspi arvense]|uniref:Zinc finger PHD-type domain-containing protein n=1 Tax=Thlaspi arvense TaxID=13288 RepID=A0AAU9RQE7_THLAR|nr:unnamed protein product [Thlaspi arvense]
MDMVGEFHKVEIDGKPYLSYLNVIKPPPQSRSQRSSDKAATHGSNDDQPLFFCPRFRTRSLLNDLDDYYPENFRKKESRKVFSKFKIPPLFDEYTSNGHHILPLFWCNNKEAGPEGECYACRVQTIGTDYYFCVECDKRYHKECVETPLEISYPSHVKHSLQLYFSKNRSDHCIYCRKRAAYAVYYCEPCDIYMHVLCAKAIIPLFIDQPKRHDHTLTLFPRQASLTCNICGLVNKLHLTYVCRSICDFVAHRDCVYIPQTIRISRHNHRISFISSLPLERRWSCGVCRRQVDCDYGAYTCNVCVGYAVHTRCALRNDIWDGIDLEGVPEVEDDVEPFEKISDGIILHFSHGHHLKIDSRGVYDACKFCQACCLPMYGDNLYACVECNFVLHETCANAPRKKLHPLHPYPLKLVTTRKEGIFTCRVCTRTSNGFIYECSEWEISLGYLVCVRCALVSEPFEYQGHQHPLFLSLDPKEKPMCHVCKSTGDHKVLNCIECDFIICFKCATLPYMVRYKHDEHYLTFCHGDEASDSDWCELCEGKLAIGRNRGFYNCNSCCTTLHIDCLLGIEPYLKPGPIFLSRRNGEVVKMHVLHNNSLSRPVCARCSTRCPYPMFLRDDENVFCFFICD